MGNSQKLEIAKIKAAGYAHKAFDALLPWCGEETHTNSLRRTTGFYGLLVGGMFAVGLDMYSADKFSEDFAMTSGANVIESLTNQAYAMKLPNACGGGEYYLAQFDGDYGFYKASKHGADALSIGAQFDVASKVDSCLDRVVKQVEGGNLNLASQFIFSGDALLSDPILVTNTGYGHSTVMFAATNGDAKALTDYADGENDFTNSVKLLNVLWDEAVYDKLSPQSIKTYIDPHHHAVAENTAQLKAVNNSTPDDGTMFGGMLMVAFAFGLAYTGVAGHSQGYRDKRQEREKKVEALRHP